jgi:ribosome-associated translation inhibitor RaiA
MRLENGGSARGSSVTLQPETGVAPSPQRFDESVESTPLVEVTTRGRVPAGAVNYARTKIARVIGRAGSPVLYAKVTLTRRPDPAVPRRAVVEAELDLNGRLMRAHRAGVDFKEAIDLVEARLADRLEHLAEHRKDRTRRPVHNGEGEWRHGDLPTRRPAHYPRPAEERVVLERKAFPIGEATVEEARFDLELLDHDFYLFRELGTGGESLLVRHPDGRYGLIRSDPDAPPPPAELIDPETGPVVDLDVDDAIERLNNTGEPYVFFRDRRSGHGTVLYWRYDGHYGLVAPAV